MILYSTVTFTDFSVVAAPRKYVAPPAEALDPNLEEMRLNSSLALKKELQLLQVPVISQYISVLKKFCLPDCVLLQEAEFNSQKAIKETLQKSERTKILINTRATDGNKQLCFIMHWLQQKNLLLFVLTVMIKPLITC